MRRLVFYYIYLLTVWLAFRLFVNLPPVIVEIWFKPVIWLVPLLWWQISDRQRPLLFGGNWWKALFGGVGVGLFYYVLVKIITKGPWFAIDINVLGIGLVTAIVEEITFAGILLPRMIKATGKIYLSLVVTSGMFALMRLPVNLFLYHLSLPILVGVLMLAFFMGLANGFIRLKSNNTLSPIVAHFFYLFAALG